MKTETPLNIVISGWYGQRNAGDDAILDVFVEQAQARLDADITVLSEIPEQVDPAPRVVARFHPVLFGRGGLTNLLRGRLWRHVDLIRRADLVVLGGGGLLRDNTNWRNLLRLLDEIWLARLFGRKTMLYAIGVGPFKTALGKWLIGASARMCDLVTVRSQRGAELLQQVGVPRERIRVVSDPAFLLAAQEPADPALRALFAGPAKKIGFYPTFAVYKRRDVEAHIRQVADALDRLVESEGVEIVAVPMSVLEHRKDDVAVARQVRAAMRHPQALHVYDKRLSAAELKWVTAQARLNITVRLHAMIFSLGCNVPVVPVNYEPKVSNVFADFGAPQYLVEIDGQLGERLAEATRLCLRNLGRYGEQIRERRARVGANAVRTFDLLAELFPQEQPQAAPAKRNNV
jgi:polysaccharide pyruvyl transferase CsaB